jgi:hypothetical protein
MVKANNFRRLILFEMAVNRIPYLSGQFLNCVGLRKNRSTERAREKSTFRGILDNKDQLIHTQRIARTNRDRLKM